MNINRYIDFTLLKPEATYEDIEKICELAIENEYYSVCVNPCWVQLCKNKLQNSNVKVITVVGFPLGANTVETKKFETLDAINNGAEEIDMVINIGMLKSNNYDYIKEEIYSLKKINTKIPLKVIIESSILSKEEIEKIVNVCNELNIDYVKTSTGFNCEGAKSEDVELINSIIKNNIKIKASGGIKNIEDVKLMISKGASRIGTSKIIKE